MEREAFLAEVLANWKKAVAAAAGPDPGDSTIWRSRERILAALQPFMGARRNHAHYPTGGGNDLRSVEIAAEPGCLSFSIADRLADIMKPSVLTLEYFPAAPRESFLLLELAALAPSGATEQPGLDKEAVLEYPRGQYKSRDLWEQGYLHHDEYGKEVALPPDCRAAIRWFRGKVLIVAKGSLWNSAPATYDGRHNAMTPAEIRAVIERAVAKRA